MIQFKLEEISLYSQNIFKSLFSDDEDLVSQDIFSQEFIEKEVPNSSSLALFDKTSDFLLKKMKKDFLTSFEMFNNPFERELDSLSNGMTEKEKSNKMNELALYSSLNGQKYSPKDGSNDFKECELEESKRFESAYDNISPQNSSFLLNKNSQGVSTLNTLKKKKSEEKPEEINKNYDKKQIYNLINSNNNENRHRCEHYGCRKTFKTQKMKVSSHDKLNKDCLLDTISLLRLIKRTKKLFYKICTNNKNNKEKKKFVRLISHYLTDLPHKDYAITILKTNI